MDFEFSDRAGFSVAGKPAAGEDSLVISGSAPVADVMFDQLEYLLSHVRQQCPPLCPECERLQQVSTWLLRPFRSSRA